MYYFTKTSSENYLNFERNSWRIWGIFGSSASRIGLSDTPLPIYYSWFCSAVNIPPNISVSSRHSCVWVSILISSWSTTDSSFLDAASFFSSILLDGSICRSDTGEVLFWLFCKILSSSYCIMGNLCSSSLFYLWVWNATSSSMLTFVRAFFKTSKNSWNSLKNISNASCSNNWLVSTLITEDPFAKFGCRVSEFFDPSGAKIVSVAGSISLDTISMYRSVYCRKSSREGLLKA